MISRSRIRYRNSYYGCTVYRDLVTEILKLYLTPFTLNFSDPTIPDPCPDPLPRQPNGAGGFSRLPHTTDLPSRPRIVNWLETVGMTSKFPGKFPETENRWTSKFPKEFPEIPTLPKFYVTHWQVLHVSSWPHSVWALY